MAPFRSIHRGIEPAPPNPAAFGRPILIYNLAVSIIYLAPHLDDVALSCGGLVWMQAQAGRKVSIWTICAGDPPEGSLSPYAREHHARWQLPLDAVASRRAEDAHSCRILGASFHHFSVPDAIYRKSPQDHSHLYISDQALFGCLHPAEGNLVERLAGWLDARISSQDRLIAPLTLGSHVDHHLTRQAAERLGVRLTYYADYPYVQWFPQTLDRVLPGGVVPQVHPLTGRAMEVWEESVAAHRSQLRTFWEDADSMRRALRAFRKSNHGIRLWVPIKG